jgi:ABC-type amino acid transport substrate-binding protein
MAGNMPIDAVSAHQAACLQSSLTRLFRPLSVCCLVLGSLCISPVFAQDGAALRACLLANNLPYSSQQDENGFDFDTAKAVAETMGRPFVPVWIQNDTRITEIDETDMPLHGLSRGECDVIFSVPGEEALKEVPKLVVGAGYYGAGFELVGPVENGPASLDTVGDKPIAVRAQTIANFMLSARKIETFTVFSLEDALSALSTGKAGAALLWGPKAGWHLHTHPDLQLKVVDADPPSVVRWNESAATRQDDAELRQGIDAALNTLGAAGTIKTLLEKYGMPAHGPFDTTYSFAEMQELMFHSLSNRQQ